MSAALTTHFHYWLGGALLLVGLYGMLAASNLIRKLMAMNIFQTAVIVFFITLGARAGGQPPIAPEHAVVVATDYANPLPHTLMLTAIVVSVSITGVALALVIRIHRRYGTLEEPELLAKLRE